MPDLAPHGTLAQTTLSSIAMAVSFSGLSLWIVIELPSFPKQSMGASEITLTLGSWLYSVISGLTLSAHLHIAYVHLSRKQTDAGYSFADKPAHHASLRFA